MSIDVNRKFATMEDIIDNFFIIKEVWEQFKVFAKEEFNKNRYISVAGFNECVIKAKSKIKETFTEEEEVAIEGFFDIIIASLQNFQTLDVFFNYVDSGLKEFEGIAAFRIFGKLLGHDDSIFTI